MGMKHGLSNVLVVLEGWERWERDGRIIGEGLSEYSVSLACCLHSLRGGHSSWLSKVVTEVEYL